jgi:hypothetical protein
MTSKLSKTEEEVIAAIDFGGTEIAVGLVGA